MLHRRLEQLIAYTSINLAGLAWAVATGQWKLRQMYDSAYFPIVIAIWIAGALGQLPRVKASTAGEGLEQQCPGTVWAVMAAQPVLWLMWRTLPRGFNYDLAKLCVFAGVLAGMGLLARRGLLPRTRKIIPGEWAVSD